MQGIRLQKNIFKTIIKILCIFIIVFSAAHTYAGSIVSGKETAQFLDLDIDADGTKDKINWRTTNGTAVVVSDTAITGQIWGETVGWINLGPTNGGVVNTCLGVLSGYAWGQNTGWINFNPTNGGVTINPSTGDFSGYAWSQNFGWIHFDPNVANKSVRTDWNGAGCTTGGGGGGGGGGGATPPNPTVDVCTNLPGIQSSVPGGYTKNPITAGIPGVCTLSVTVTLCSDGIDNDGDGLIDYPSDPGCVSYTDNSELNSVSLFVCSDGIDNDGDGLIDYPSDPGCSNGLDMSEYNVPVDACPTIPGNQPSGTNCNLPIIDVCPLLPGVQTSTASCPVIGPLPIDPLPVNPSPIDPVSGRDGGNGGVYDYCPDIEGIQESPRACPGYIQPLAGVSNGGFAPSPFAIATSSIVKKLDELPVPVEPVAAVVAGLGIIASIPGLITRLLHVLLTVFAYRRQKQWGIVYDSITKEPLDPAIVTVIDVATGNEIDQKTTDIEGRYGFLLQSGAYRITAGKSHYQFPSQILAGKTSDEAYNNLYFGDVFTVDTNSATDLVVTLNIPMDKMGEDWNQQEKKRMGIFHYFTIKNEILNKIFKVLFLVGFILSVGTALLYPGLWNYSIIFIYIIIAILGILGAGPVHGAQIMYQGKPLSYAYLQVFNAHLHNEVAHRVANEQGQYYILIPNGDYYMTISQRNPDGSKTLVHTTEPFEITKGVINENFAL